MVNKEKSIYNIAKDLKSKDLNVIDMLFDLVNLLNISDENKESLYNKALSCQDKINMMRFSSQKSLWFKAQFEATQNMDIPCLIGDDETELLFYTESTIIFARTALDVLTPIISQAVYKKREDSFNSFSKRIRNDLDERVEPLKRKFYDYENDETHACLLLCGSEKGRALRDQLIHQTTIKLDYLEYSNSDKEMLFLLLNKGTLALPFDLFIPIFVYQVYGIIKDMARTTIEVLKSDDDLYE